MGVVLIMLRTHAPAFLRLGIEAAIGIGHDLVTEANAEHRNAHLAQLLEEGDQRDHPRAAFVGAVFGTGQDVTVEFIGRGQGVARHWRQVGKVRLGKKGR
ncbi:hypothetical protein D3C86_1626110 [compost metagenome]